MAENPQPCRTFTAPTHGGPPNCATCGYPEIAHHVRMRHGAIAPKVFSLVKHVFPLLAAIDLEGYLTDAQYDSIILEMHKMGIDINRGGINDIFQRAHDSLKPRG